MKKIVLIMSVVAAVLLGFLVDNIIKENQEIKKLVYTTLEKETLSDDEKEFVKFAIDPREMKESYVSLDSKHEQLFNKHMGN